MDSFNNLSKKLVFGESRGKENREKNMTGPISFFHRWFVKRSAHYPQNVFLITRLTLIAGILFAWWTHPVPGRAADGAQNLFLLLPVVLVIWLALNYYFFLAYLKNTRLYLLNAPVWDVSDLMEPSVKELLFFPLKYSVSSWLSGVFFLFLSALAALWFSENEPGVPAAVFSIAAGMTLAVILDYFLLSDAVSPALCRMQENRFRPHIRMKKFYDESLAVFGCGLAVSLFIYGIMTETYQPVPSFWPFLTVWLVIGLWIVIRRQGQWNLYHRYTDTDSGQREWAAGNFAAVPELWALIQTAEKTTRQFYELFRNIENNSSEMNAAAKVVTETSAEQNAALIRQSASVTQTSSTLQELVQASRQIADSASAVVSYAENTEKKSDQGLRVMKDTVARVQKVREGNEINLSEVIVLSEAIIEIDHVLNFIISIADETNLIALNAAIEASSAGEQGKRFKIVANEVRELSTRVTKSIRSVKDITRKIQDAASRLVQTVQDHQEVIDESVRWVDQALVNLEEILDGASQSAEAAKQIYIAIQQQKIANQQIAVSFSDISGDIRHIAGASDRYDQYVKTLRKFSANIESALHSVNTDLMTESGDEWNLR